MCEKPVLSDSSPGSMSASEDGLSHDVPHLEPIDRAVEKRLIRKCDLHVIPVLSLLYSLAFIDRINIGNARLQGLEKDLKMKGQDYNVALFVFFIPYILFEVPSNLLIRKIAPSTWLSSIMILWGIVTVCMGVTQSYAGLVVCRFFLGLCEAGFFPGCMYLMSMYYRRYELQWRFNLFFSAVILAGAWSGLLAYALAKMAGIGGYDGWRWIFIIEGLATFLFAVVSRFFIVDWPETAKFLSAEERQLLIRRLSEDAADARMDRLDSKARRRAFGDWKIYIGILMYLGVNNTGYSTSFFTPTILSELGWTAVRAQVLSIPIYIVAAVTCLMSALLTDRLRHRYAFAMLGVVTASIGYIILLAQESVSVGTRYFAVYLVMAGGYITQPITLVWLSNNMGGHYKRSINAAMQIGFGNFGGIIASNIYVTNQRPRYPVGYGVSLALIWMCGIACTVFAIGLRLENQRRERGERDARLSLPREEVENLGDDHPNFRFTY
ncbi:hypothetical protein HO173_007467 [Letharia columbiana]|uniref:Major facilitator superfamily (MFS) profile domain-containing protein n=1 Tax=Letharia columbiana TaxID=112416 RepID=A0A8H6FTF1_9LECA|nr:uncharacterized protein HO173_007467 [Letharia columbiana]KAF6234434.1 hypothetical protein HO173_007467 [Letharia columbiana]